MYNLSCVSKERLTLEFIIRSITDHGNLLTLTLQQEIKTEPIDQAEILKRRIDSVKDLDEDTRTVMKKILPASSYAPAHYKRMLAIVQLNPGEEQIRSALRAAGAFRDRLDPVSRQLLGAYEALLRHGEVEAAQRSMRDLVAAYPEAVDAWFALGELQFHFAPLLGTPMTEAEAAFREAARLDPSFAAPVGP